MPLYLYEHVDTGEIVEIAQHMSEVHVYHGSDGTQVGKWRRRWSKPQASMDTRADPYSARDFAKVTNKRGTVGDLWERSAELSAARAGKEGGHDPVKSDFYNKYSEKRHGQKHPEQVREEGAKKLKQIGVNLDWGG